MRLRRHRYGQKGERHVEHRWKQRLQALERFGEGDALAVPRVELCANKQAVIEGCRGILSYNETAVKLSCGALALELSGEALCLNHLSDQRVCVSGTVTALRFVSA